MKKYRKISIAIVRIITITMMIILRMRIIKILMILPHATITNGSSVHDITMVVTVSLLRLSWLLPCWETRVDKTVANGKVLRE